ncbi:hypothetical protein BD289DRAFT_486972 [Coniella lustricola]|uniref:RhoGAP-domain-containing protein n=1 Tax=Coniella lustricola TaxID=2025994 RepID=A0A2T2ZTC5_9PEZI|nr:hypothetical protein BD289DRAFT_486972 [Coniella lustricola]
MSQLAHQNREHPSNLHYAQPASPGGRGRAQSTPQSPQTHPALSASRPAQSDNRAQHHHRPDAAPYTPISPTNFDYQYNGSTQDSPTIGRPSIVGSNSRLDYQSRPAHIPSPIAILPLGSPSSAFGSSPNSPLSSAGARFRKPAPSPLHNTTAISPPTSASPIKSAFSHSGTPVPFSPLQASSTIFPASSAPTPRFVHPDGQDDPDGEYSYYNSDSSGTATPEDTKAPEFLTSPQEALKLHIPDESTSEPKPVNKTGALANTKPSAVPGSSKMEAIKAPPRNPSIDSAVSNISSTSLLPKSPQDVAYSPADVEKLVKAAGSPEAVIAHLLKDKNSQSQQNAQLWRLVDKQRAMILGLNKDLERSLKEKEKYRRKLKDLMTSQATPPASSPGLTQESEDGSSSVAQSLAAPIPTLAIPPSQHNASDAASPTDLSMAPYPITPPADRTNNGSPPAIGEILNPSHHMPEASEHALDRYDPDEEEREAEEARRKADATNELSLSTPLPPRISSRHPPNTPIDAAFSQLQSQHQHQPQPEAAQPETAKSTVAQPVVAAPPASNIVSNFPPPPMPPPPRKPPPAPLQLKATRSSSTLTEREGDSDTDSEYASENAEAMRIKRGRRRTREEDDEMREILALKEAEARSLSKKSKHSSSNKGTPKEPPPEVQLSVESPGASPRTTNPLNAYSEALGSLNGMLSARNPAADSPMLSPGLSVSPHPLAVGSGPNSPPLSPPHTGLAANPLSPRAPRQQIPLPPNTPLQTPQGELVLKSPQPLNIVKSNSTSVETVDTPSSSALSAAERTKVYKGFVSEEYPELLIPPNALIAVMVKVASSRMKPSRASLISLTQLEEDPVFTLAIVSRTDGGELWRVEKDSLSLVKLDSKLKQCAAFSAKTPDRSLFSGHAPAKLDARRRALDQYLEDVFSTPFDAITALDLCKYLSTNVLPPNADEMGSATGQDEEGAPKSGPGGRQYKSGYLTKRGKNFGGWKARFFAVEGPLLKYYETPGGAHLGTIKLQGAQIGRQSHSQNDPTSPAGINDDDDNQYRHAFLILEPKKKDPSSMTKHVLCAEGDKERDAWVSVLLPWTNYQDPAPREKESKAQSGRSSYPANSKVTNTKKKQGRSQQQVQQQSRPSDDTLIGVSYDATKQGDIPSTEYTESPTVVTVPSQMPYSISAPRDPYMIPDPVMWQNKMGGLLPPGTDEKKAKKRSFFGFGPKQRSSSDGTDSLHSEQGAAFALPVYTGPVRRVFGAPLSEAVKYNSPRDVRVPLPAVMYRCIQYLDARGAITEEGIFRLSGSNVVIKQLKERFDTEGDINLLEDEQYHDIHAVASMMKAYLRELPTSILTRDLHMDFVAVTEMNTQTEKIAALQELVKLLPLANGALLRYLIAFLIKIINNADRNKMTVRNVGIVFSPTLTIPAPVFALLLQNYEAIFGIPPEEYELPPRASMEDRTETGSMEGPTRPATSGGLRESPHRHRLTEALADQRRGNTPPPSGAPHAPLGGASQMRSTPTPPLLQRYEPNPYAQQHGNSAAGMRAGYDNTPMSSGPDPNQYYLAQQRQGNERSVSYEQPSTSRTSRRESSMFMGLPPRGLTPQGSSSRLREETRYI